MGFSPNDNSTTFYGTRYGNFTANFREAPSPIPREIWISLFGIMLGTFMSSVVLWLNGWRQRRNFYQYMKKLPSKCREVRTEKNRSRDHTEIR